MGSRNFLWLLDRPELTEDFLSIQKAVTARACEEGEVTYGVRWGVPSFIALMQMPLEAYNQDMQALKSHVAACHKEDMPLVDVGHIAQMCAQTRLVLCAFESLAAFVWSVDKVHLKTETTPIASCLASWSPSDAPLPQWQSYKLISSMTQMLDARLNTFMGHLETAGHSYLDWLWTEPQSDEEQTASDTSESEDEESDTDDGAPPAT